MKTIFLEYSQKFRSKQFVKIQKLESSIMSPIKYRTLFFNI